MTRFTPVRTGLRTALMGTAVLGLAAILCVPPWSGPAGTGAAFAQDQGGSHGSGGGQHAGGGTAGSGHRGGATGSGSGSGTESGSGHSSAATSRGQGASGPPSGSGSEDAGRASGRGHYGQGGSSGEETGEEGPSADRKGPQFGGGANSNKPTAGTTGGRPVWAKEGIPEIELGRLSVARAPSHVLQKAATEAVSNWTTMGSTVLTLAAPDQPTLTMTVAELYSKPAAEFAQIVQTYYPSIVRIDSPLENLGLLKEVRTDNTTPLTGVSNTQVELTAIFLGSASDKTIPVTPDTVTAINTILQLPALSEAQTAEIAAKAEAVRSAIATGHGE